MQKIRWFFMIVGILLALAMAWQNQTQVDIQLLWLKQSLPLSVLLLSFTAVGFLFGALMTASMLRSRKAAQKKAKKEAAESNSPVESAPTSP